MEEIYEKGIEIFGSLYHFKKWVLRPCIGIGDSVPFNMLWTIEGRAKVLEGLMRIEHGDLA